MSADIINLNKARKAKAKAGKAQQAQANRARFGRTRLQQELEAMQKERGRREVDGAQRPGHGGADEPAVRRPESAGPDDDTSIT